MKISDTSMMANIRWNWFLFKINWSNKNVQRKRKILRGRFCNKGIHHLKKGSLEHISAKGRKTYIQYLACSWCGYKFFANKKEKLKYERMTKGNASAMRKVFRAISNRNIYSDRRSSLSKGRSGQK